MKKIYLLITLICFYNVKAFAEEGAGQFSFTFENDAFYDTDKDYTDGVFLLYTPKNSRFNFTLAQEMYTPKERDANIYPEDHPYAGWLYLKTEYKKLLTENFLPKIALSLGVTGKDSYAEDAQDLVHELLDDHEYEGWKYQIPERKGYSFDLSLNYLIPSLSVDTSFLDFQTIIFAFGTVGNIKNLGGAGSEIKFGYNVDKFSDKISSDKNFKLYSFASLKTYAVDSNYLIEGNNGRTIDGITYDVKLEKQVSQWSFGVVTGLGNTELKMYAVQYTKKYEAQVGNDRYAGITLSWKH